MGAKYPGEAVVQHAENFHWNTDGFRDILKEDRNAFLNLEILHDIVVDSCKSDSFHGMCDKEKVEQFFKMIFRTIKRTKDEIQLCFEIAPEMSVVNTFITLCTFLHTSKKIKGESIKDFVRYNNPLDFSNPDSKNYRDPALLENETEKLKKYRMRLLKQGKVYIKNQQWNAITQDSVYEWGFYYDMEKVSLDLQEYLKREKNMYSDIRSALQSKRDDDFANRMQAAYKKFLSKLKKIQYGKYLELQKVFLSRICSNKEYYGINLYRLERRMRPYGIIHEVKKLEVCTTEEEEAETLLKTVYLDDICFPAIYEKLFMLPLALIGQFAEAFSQYIMRFAVESCLILDELIEDGVFGNSWETLFRDMSNELAEMILYDPTTIDFSATEASQVKFRRLLHAGVFVEICAACNRKFRMEELLI